MTSKQARLSIEQVPIGDLRPDPFNPRRISDGELETLVRSVREFGLVDPIIARREDLTVIGGHQRLVAARKLGLETVPVIYVDLSPEQAKLLNLALNKISGEWDQELLARLLSDLQQVPDVDIGLSGFDKDEIAKLQKTLDAREKRDRLETFDMETALEAARAAPGVERGDIWRLGDHRIMCGDSAEGADVSRLMAGQGASMAFTDPPYNVSYGDHGGATARRRRRIANDDMGPEEWEEFVRKWGANLLGKVDGALYICMSCKEWPTVSRVLEELSGHWSTTIIWAKDRFVLGRADYQRQYEPVWYGWREGSKHEWCGDRDQGDVWTIARPAESGLHPTMKPVELVQRAIENSSRADGTVLDLFLGSGTTLIAAERTGRRCYGMELEPHYCALVIARWEAFSGGKAEKVSK